MRSFFIILGTAVAFSTCNEATCERTMSSRDAEMGTVGFGEGSMLDVGDETSPPMRRTNAQEDLFDDLTPAEASSVRDETSPTFRRMDAHENVLEDLTPAEASSVLLTPGCPLKWTCCSLRVSVVVPPQPYHLVDPDPTPPTEFECIPPTYPCSEYGPTWKESTDMMNCDYEEGGDWEQDQLKMLLEMKMSQGFGGSKEATAESMLDVGDETSPAPMRRMNGKVDVLEDLSPAEASSVRDETSPTFRRMEAQENVLEDLTPAEASSVLKTQPGCPSKWTCCSLRVSVIATEFECIPPTYPCSEYGPTWKESMDMTSCDYEEGGDWEQDQLKLLLEMKMNQGLPVGGSTHSESMLDVGE